MAESSKREDFPIRGGGVNGAVLSAATFHDELLRRADQLVARELAMTRSEWLAAGGVGEFDEDEAALAIRMDILECVTEH